MTSRRTTRSNGGRRAKATGKRGERNAQGFLEALGCKVAFTEIQGLAGDDKFIRDPNGKWWSVEVKNCVTSQPKWVKQTIEQAEARFHAIQSELSGEHSDLYYALGLDRYRKGDWMLMWHPNNWGLSADTWCIIYCKNGRRIMDVMTLESGWVPE